MQLTTAEDEVSIREVMRLTVPGKRKACMLARWENIYRMWEAGKTLGEIAAWYSLSESTIRQLLKRAALERQKKPGFKWPVDEQGRCICDIAHPMPKSGNPIAWAHRRGHPLLKHDSERMRRMYCPVCKGVYFQALTLTEVFQYEIQTRDKP
jgi:hypothetical protein